MGHGRGARRQAGGEVAAPAAPRSPGGRTRRGGAPRRPRLGLVLGAGGTVGMAYHAGVLRALDEAGLPPGSADLVVGTSAGSLVGAYLRSGFGPEDLWSLAMGTHPTLSPLAAESEIEVAGGPVIFGVAVHGPIDLARRSLGSAYVLARSAVRFPSPPVPRWLRELFPGGLFDMVEARRRFAEDLPEAWPERDLWVVAVDIVSGRRVVLGRGDEPPPPLARAVTASCSIPGVYPPVRIGRQTLVDGGAHSSTNLDLAVAGGCDVIVCSAPMAFDSADPPDRAQQLARRLAARALRAEASAARASGAEVLLLRPTAAEVRLHGYRLMRQGGWGAVAEAAYEVTTTALAGERGQRVLAAAAGAAQRS